MVLAVTMRGKTRGRIQIGADDPSLTAAGGMLAVTELCERLGLIAALDEGMGPVKQRRRGFTGGQVLAGMAAAQLAGEDFLVGLDRVRADQAGQLVTPVPGLATSTAAGIARRFTQEHWRGAEAGLARATAAMIGLLPAERAAELAEGPVTIDIDATDVEVYGSKKRGVAYNYQGQRAGRPHVASWAETEIPLAAGLLSGDQDPRSHVTGLLGRALAAVPQAVRDGAAAAGRKIALRADAGYFAGELARAAAAQDMAFAIGAKRIPSMWKALAAVPGDAWRDAIDMDNAQVAVSPYRPADWPDGTVLLIRRVRLDPDQVSADPRSRRRRTLHPDQRAMLFPELAAEPAIYAYSFICTNIDVSTPAKAAAAEHWYRHRTSAENIFRDSKHGAALRHLPSGHQQASTAWMWASLIAAAIAAWLHQLTGLIDGGELVAGHGTRGGKAMIATLRRVLIAVPARLVRHGGQLFMRLAPGERLLPGILAAIRALPAPAG
jgi:Transposase DDE domain group 1